MANQFRVECPIVYLTIASKLHNRFEKLKYSNKLEMKQYVRSPGGFKMIIVLYGRALCDWRYAAKYHFVRVVFYHPDTKQEEDNALFL